MDGDGFEPWQRMMLRQMAQGAGRRSAAAEVMLESGDLFDGSDGEDDVDE